MYLNCTHHGTMTLLLFTTPGEAQCCLFMPATRQIATTATTLNTVVAAAQNGLTDMWMASECASRRRLAVGSRQKKRRAGFV